MKEICCYEKETFPENIKFLVDTPITRKVLKNLFGTTVGSESLKCEAYLKVNVDEKTWAISPAFVWLYRNTPPLINLTELVEITGS